MNHLVAADLRRLKLFEREDSWCGQALQRGSAPQDAAKRFSLSPGVRVGVRASSRSRFAHSAPVSRLNTSAAHAGARNLQAAFTLIELMLVMALLVIVIAVSFPSLQNFFRGRTLDSEARRFLSLTRYGQTRAVSEGIPMVLWIDARARNYGLQAEAGFLDKDPKAVQFNLDDGLDVIVAAAPVPANFGTNVRERGRTTQATPNLPAIRFWPDGFLVETSPDYVELRENRSGLNSSVWIAQTPNRLAYALQSAQPLVARR